MTGIFRSSLVIMLAALFFACEQPKPTSQWSLVINEPDGNEIKLLDLPILDEAFSVTKEIADYRIEFSLVPQGTFTAFEASVSSFTEKAVFLSLVCNYQTDESKPYNFNGEVDSAEIYRQSPHDVDAWIVETIAMQAVPLVALKRDSIFTVAVSDAPFAYDNFTTQAFYPEQGTMRLSSGDNAQTPDLQPDFYGLSKSMDVIIFIFPILIHTCKYSQY